MHRHDKGHFSWCPASLRITAICVCNIFIYVVMLAVGLLFSYAQFKIADIALSEAIRADAIHLATDCGSSFVASLVSLFSVFYAEKKTPLEKYGAYIQAGLLWIAAGMVFVFLASRLFQYEPIHALLMMAGGAVGAIGAGIKFFILHRKAGEWNEIRWNEKRHALADMWTSLGVIFGGGAYSVAGIAAEAMNVDGRAIGWTLDAVITLFILKYVSNLAVSATRNARLGKMAGHE
ncbi:cation transporter [bacterium]|nr:cation transporter [bacterium]